MEGDISKKILDIIAIRLKAHDKAHEGGMDLDEFQRAIESYVSEMMTRVVHYLHCNEIPPPLCDVLASMTIDLIRAEGVLDQILPTNEPSRLQLGDAQVAFESSPMNRQQLIYDVVRAYKQDLYYYRKMAN